MKKSDVIDEISETCACGSSTTAKSTNGGCAASNQISTWREEHYCTVRPTKANDREVTTS